MSNWTIYRDYIHGDRTDRNSRLMAIEAMTNMLNTSYDEDTIEINRYNLACLYLDDRAFEKACELLEKNVGKERLSETLLGIILTDFTTPMYDPKRGYRLLKKYPEDFRAAALLFDLDLKAGKWTDAYMDLVYVLDRTKDCIENHPLEVWQIMERLIMIQDAYDADSYILESFEMVKAQCLELLGDNYQPDYEETRLIESLEHIWDID